MRQTRLQLAQNDLNQQQILAEIDYQLAILKPQYNREKELFDKNLISKQQFERTEEQYKYNIKRKKFTYLAYRNDSIARVRQLKELNDSERRMMGSLSGVARILDNLVVKAPFGGQVTMPQMEVGQSVTTGQRLGQVDVIGSFIVRCPIDELYLERISTGLIATYRTYRLRITYIYPTINNGRFEVDMEFVDGNVPPGVIRGQSMRLRIALGKSSEQILLPVGGFYKDTGGNWAFVLSSDESIAEKKPIRLGRKNTEYYEVTSGLESGDKVVTSSYDNYGDNEVLVLNF